MNVSKPDMMMLSKEELDSVETPREDKVGRKRRSKRRKTLGLQLKPLSGFNKTRQQIINSCIPKSEPRKGMSDGNKFRGDKKRKRKHSSFISHEDVKGMPPPRANVKHVDEQPAESVGLLTLKNRVKKKALAPRSENQRTSDIFQKQISIEYEKVPVEGILLESAKGKLTNLANASFSINDTGDISFILNGKDGEIHCDENKIDYRSTFYENRLFISIAAKAGKKSGVLRWSNEDFSKATFVWPKREGVDDDAPPKPSQWKNKGIPLDKISENECRKVLHACEPKRTDTWTRPQRDFSIKDRNRNTVPRLGNSTGKFDRIKSSNQSDVEKGKFKKNDRVQEKRRKFANRTSDTVALKTYSKRAYVDRPAKKMPDLVRQTNLRRSSRIRNVGHSKRVLSEEDSRKVLLIYPSNGLDKVTVYRGDLERCEEGVFLNDSIINFYLKYLFRDHKFFTGNDRQKKIQKKMKQQVYVFNTFFFNRLLEDKSSKSYRVVEKLKYTYANVKSWTKNVDIFEKKFIIVPINENLHWCVAIICNVNMLVKPQSKETISRERGCILILDSLGQGKNAKKYSRILREYLKHEWRNRKAHSSDAENEYLNEIFCEKSLPLRIPKLPLQNNGSDCGVFLLEYVERFLKECLSNITFTEHDLQTKFARFIAPNWFNQTTIRNKRKAIEQILLQSGRNYETEIATAVKERGTAASDSDDDIVVVSLSHHEREGDKERISKSTKDDNVGEEIADEKKSTITNSIKDNFSLDRQRGIPQAEKLENVEDSSLDLETKDLGCDMKANEPLMENLCRENSTSKKSSVKKTSVEVSAESVDIVESTNIDSNETPPLKNTNTMVDERNLVDKDSEGDSFDNEKQTSNNKEAPLFNEKYSDSTAIMKRDYEVKSALDKHSNRRPIVSRSSLNDASIEADSITGNISPKSKESTTSHARLSSMSMKDNKDVYPCVPDAYRVEKPTDILNASESSLKVMKDEFEGNDSNDKCVIPIFGSHADLSTDTATENSALKSSAGTSLCKYSKCRNTPSVCNDSQVDIVESNAENDSILFLREPNETKQLSRLSPSRKVFVIAGEAPESDENVTSLLV